MAEKFGVFGDPPRDLVTPPDGAQQFSPLYPGSASLEDCAPASLSGFAMLAPPGTIERRYALALALRAVKPGATLTALAPKDKGGSRLKKELSGFGTEVEEEAKSHHRICVCRAPHDTSALESAIQEGAPLFFPETQLWTQPGVFSWNRVDPGSALLVEYLPELKGRGADLGAGLGYLTREALKGPLVQEIHLFEIDRRAVEAARKNVGQDPRVRIHWADLRRAELPERLDFVITNPPFHDGGKEDQSLGQEFLRRSAQALKPGGTCWIVANRHLPYEALLQSVFREVKPRAENNAFKIYEAVK